MAILSGNIKRKKRHFRSRKKIVGTQARPRLFVFRSNKHIAAQIIVDADPAVNGDSAKTLCSCSSTGDSAISGGNIAGASIIGTKIAELAKSKGIDKVVFDRGGNIYHGRIQALADAAREAGLEF